MREIRISPRAVAVCTSCPADAWCVRARVLCVCVCVCVCVCEWVSGGASPPTGVEVTAITRVAPHLQLAPAIQGVAGNLGEERQSDV
jgi:hypothetical protein